MSKQAQIITLSIGLIALFVIYFFNLYKSVKIEQDILNQTRHIHALRIQNILINEQISNDFKRQNYDKLNQTMNAFLSNWDKLRDDIKVKFANQKNIISYIQDLDNSVTKEHQLCLHYESDKAVLANSVFFLVQLESKINSKDDPVLTEYSNLINTVLKNIIYYNVGLPEIKENVNKLVAFVDQNKSHLNVDSQIVKKHAYMFYDKSYDIFKTIDEINELQISSKLNKLENLFFEAVDHERETRRFINILVAIFSFFMLLGFLVTFFKTYYDKEKISKLQIENEQKNHAIMEQIQLLNEYKKAMDASSIISKTDLQGNITYVNEKFCTISGYKEEELIGKPHNLIRHEDMPKEIFYELWQTIQNKKVFHDIIKNKKKNGDVYYVDTTIIPILNIDGEISEYFAVRHDVTELINAKEEALAAEKTKSTFLATMSHELRTPLNAVIGFSQILLSKNDIPTQTIMGYIDKINIAGKHLLNIVNNILDFSKIESHKMDLNKKTIDLDYIIDSTIPLVETSANAKNIKIKKNQFSESKISADEQLLKQVVLNILSNAIKFTPEDKTITVSYRPDNNFDVISICDEGIGLTKEQIEKIFQPFSQIDEHQNKAIKGTGLGLAISQKIMQLHNGYIEVESEVGVGSCFNIHIPKAQETE